MEPERNWTGLPVIVAVQIADKFKDCPEDFT